MLFRSVVVKLFSETITHKTDVGGVQLDVRNATAEVAVDLIESLFGKSTLMRK